MMRAVATGAAAMLAAAIWALPAGAEDGPLPTLDGSGGAASPPGWTTQCEATARDQPLSCAMEQRAVLKGTGQIVAAITIRVPAETRKPVLLVRVPLGLSLESGVTLAVDGAGGRSLPLQTCDNGGCYAGAPLPPELLAAFSKGEKLDVVFQNVNKVPIKLTMSLAGFTASYGKIK